VIESEGGTRTVRRSEQTVGETLLAALSKGQRQVIGRLADAFAAGGQELFIVGGIVRDLLLARPLPHDLDFATSAMPETTHSLGLAAGAISAYLVGERFGTVGLVFDGGDDRIVVEITTYRSEHYPDTTRFPAVELGGQIEDDLARRDFTVNAIAVDARSGTLVDPFEGQADIALAVLRAVGDADARVAEDPLRLLRAARFVAQLGFRVDAATEAAMAHGADNLRWISQERQFAELTKLLLGEYAGHGLDLLHRTGLLAVAMPEMATLAADAEQTTQRRVTREKDLWEHTKRVVQQAPPRPIVRWAALLHDAGKPRTRGIDASGEVHFFGHERVGADLALVLLRRLKADKTTQVAVSRLVELHSRPATYQPDWSDSAVRRLALEAGAVWDDLLDLAAADVTSSREYKRIAAAARVAGLREHFARLQAEAALDSLQSPLDGHELMAIFDRPPGIWIKWIKDHLREMVIDGDLAPDDKITAERIARELIGTDPSLSESASTSPPRGRKA